MAFINEAMSRSQLYIDVDVQGSLNSKQLDRSSPKMLSSSIGVLFGFLCYDRGSILM